MSVADFFVYDDGRLLWKVTRPGRGCVAGKEAGARAHHGYHAVMVNGKKFYAHRIVWELLRGPIPIGMCIDHIDGDTSNNQIENLRLVTLSGNQRNRRLGVLNRFGIHGLSFRQGGFSVYCAKKYIGYYKDFFEACCARKSAELRAGYHINSGRKI